MADPDKGKPMPSGSMKDQARGSGAMPKGTMNPSAEAASGGPPSSARSSSAGTPPSSSGSSPASKGPISVLVEMRIPAEESVAFAGHAATRMQATGFQIDASYAPVPMAASAPTAGARSEQTMIARSEQTVIVRGDIAPDRIAELEARPEVVRVWRDTPISPFSMMRSHPMDASEVTVAPRPAFRPCPIGTCDCTPRIAKGTLADVARHLGVNQIWEGGHRGDGIVVGIVDGGVTAAGRPINRKDAINPEWPNKLIDRVIDGWPANSWGTTGVAWGWHGNMCSTDVLGMAPNVQLLDIRVSDGNLISSAIAGYQWAIDRHRANGTPHILTNSWGIFREAEDRDYARNPQHPFTRKVVEALDRGILVLFAAGNCGATCPDSRCDTDIGPGRSIWGANGHPRVMTVGAVNNNDQLVGYSSQGPAALDANKPDFCSITHFTGFTRSDNGTSAAAPIAAGVVALLKQAVPKATQDQVKAALKLTAKDIGPVGFDQHSGAGIIHAKRAYDRMAQHTAWSGWRSRGGSSAGVGMAAPANRLDLFSVGLDRTLWHRSGNGTTWANWENLGGECYSAPAAVSWGPNRIDVFALGQDRAVWHKWWDGTAWHGFDSLGGSSSDGVGAASWGVNRLGVFTIGADRAVWHKWWDGTKWSAWESLGGRFTSAPSAVAWGPRRIDVFAIGEDRAVQHKWWNGSMWQGWENLGGSCTTGTAAASSGPDRLDVFALSVNRTILHRSWSGGSWMNWEDLGFDGYSAPAAVARSANQLEVVVVGRDHAVWHDTAG